MEGIPRRRSTRKTRSSKYRRNSSAEKQSLYGRVQQYAMQLGLDGGRRSRLSYEEEDSSDSSNDHGSATRKPLSETKIFQACRWTQLPAGWDDEFKYETSGPVDADKFLASIGSSGHSHVRSRKQTGQGKGDVADKVERPSVADLRHMNFEQWKKDNEKYVRKLRVKYSPCNEFLADALALAKHNPTA